MNNRGELDPVPEVKDWDGELRRLASLLYVLSCTYESYPVFRDLSACSAELFE